MMEANPGKAHSFYVVWRRFLRRRAFYYRNSLCRIWREIPNISVAIDDTVFMRTMISDIINSDPNMEVVGTAADGKLGLEKVKECNPDVVTCDVETPSLDGIGFLKKIMVDQLVTEILKNLEPGGPPVLVVQHMPEHFTKALAERIALISKIKVVEAQNGMFVEKRTAYIAPGNRQMRVTKEVGRLKIKIDQSDLVSGHRPSVDALFESLLKIKGQSIIGVLMTGMGRDDATELKKMKDLGNHTICQNEETCVVYGMPKAANQEGGADEVLSLEGIISRLKWISQRKESGEKSLKKAQAA